MKALLATALLFTCSSLQAQVADTLQHNNTKVTLPEIGNFFADNVNFSSGYEVPKGSGNNTMFEGRFYFMGVNINNQLHASWGGNNNGIDVISGPYSTLGNYDSLYQANWSGRTVQICQEEIDMYALWWEACNSPNPPIPCNQAPVPSNDLLTRIYDWPAHGNTANGEAYELAPYYDHPESTQGVYDPAGGDYPIIKGCCATYRIDNDRKLHTFSGGDPLGIETHYQTYQFKNWGLTNDVTFVEITVFNRGTTSFPEFVYGMYLDSQLGDWSDDYMGSDSTRSMYYTYNADNNDGQYGIDPPAFGVVALEAPLTSVVNYSGQSSLVEVWNQMNGLSGSGQPILDNQGVPTSFEYGTSPNVANGWSEVTMQNSPSDRRAIISTKHGAFSPGDSFTQTYAFVYRREGDHLQSVDALLAAADEVHNFYDTLANTQCENGVLSLNEVDALPEAVVYPNPSSNLVQIELDVQEVATIQLLDMGGRLVKTVEGSQYFELDVSTVQEGAYMLLIKTSRGSIMEKLLINH